MSKQESEGRWIARVSDEELASIHLGIIERAFGDIFDKYFFSLKTRSTEIISFENDNFAMRFHYERNRYGIVDFNGAGIVVKRSGNEHALLYVCDILSKAPICTHERRYRELVNMTGEQKHRYLWNEYVDETLADFGLDWDWKVSKAVERAFPGFLK
jgi:hypothetical protein